MIAVEYNMYMQLGVAGLRALENYNLEDHVCPIDPIIYHPAN
jgi:hypothetical protein